jgi:hypothetical protein
MVQLLNLLLLTTLTLTAVFQFQPCDAFVSFQMPGSPGRNANPWSSFASTKGAGSTPFYATLATSTSATKLPTPEESAAALTAYMAKAHGEKLRAIADVETKYKAEVAELKLQLKEYETEKDSATGAIKTSANSYEFPSSNKDLTNKVATYHKFISGYIVKAQIERVKAVTAMEQATKAKYEAIIDSMKQEPSGSD